ncbi:MAG: hypothetical protein QXI11_04930 [Thermoproteota archaeon]
MPRIDLKKVLEDVAPELGLTSDDIQLILLRIQKLIQMKATRGRDLTVLTLACAFQYLMWPKANKCPLPPSLFLKICREKGYNVSQRDLYQCARLFKSKEFFQDMLSPEEMLNRVWFYLKKEFKLSDDVKEYALRLIRSYRLPGTNRWGLLATAVYVTCRYLGRNDITQTRIAQRFGVTEVTIRNIVKRMKIPSIDPYVNYG